MGFSFKVAPGVRVRASSHGVRATVGPRAARVHVGTGRTGFSTGVGPVSLYKSAGGGRRPQNVGQSRSSVAAHERQLRQAQKAQQAAELKAAFDAIENLHRQEVIPTTPPVAPTPAPVNEAAIHRWHEQQAPRGLSIMQRQARTTARKRAAEGAQRDINAAVERGFQEQAQVQRQLSEQWRRLLGNDPDVVFATLTEAFEDNQAPVAVTGVENGEASVLIMVPDIEAVPERMPKRTPAGNLSIAKITKTLRNSVYLGLICGHVLITVREALAVAPGLQAVRIAVIRQAPHDAYGIRKAECLLAAMFTRHRLDGVLWGSAAAIQIVQDTAADLRIRLSGTREPLPLDLAREPALAALLQVIDTSESEPPGRVDEPGDGSPGHTAGSQLPGAAAAHSTVSAPTLLMGQPPTTSTAMLPAPHPPRSGRGTGRATSRARKAALITLGALVLMFVIGLASSHSTKATPTGNASAAATSTPTHAATSSPTPHAGKAKKTMKKKKPRPKKTTSPAVAATPPPAATTPSTVASSPAAATPAGCSPLSNEGTCYEPGEFCRNSDHGMSGIAGDGEAITCEDNDGWRWEPS
jgi:hypothetical protein